MSAGIWDNKPMYKQMLEAFPHDPTRVTWMKEVGLLKSARPTMYIEGGYFLFTDSKSWKTGNQKHQDRAHSFKVTGKVTKKDGIIYRKENCTRKNKCGCSDDRCMAVHVISFDKEGQPQQPQQLINQDTLDDLYLLHYQFVCINTGKSRYGRQSGPAGAGGSIASGAGPMRRPVPGNSLVAVDLDQLKRELQLLNQYNLIVAGNPPPVQRNQFLNTGTPPPPLQHIQQQQMTGFGLGDLGPFKPSTAAQPVCQQQQHVQQGATGAPYLSPNVLPTPTQQFDLSGHVSLHGGGSQPASPGMPSAGPAPPAPTQAAATTLQLSSEFEEYRRGLPLYTAPGATADPKHVPLSSEEEKLQMIKAVKEYQQACLQYTNNLITQIQGGPASGEVPASGFANVGGGVNDPMQQFNLLQSTATVQQALEKQLQQPIKQECPPISAFQPATCQTPTSSMSASSAGGTTNNTSCGTGMTTPTTREMNLQAALFSQNFDIMGTGPPGITLASGGADTHNSRQVDQQPPTTVDNEFNMDSVDVDPWFTTEGDNVMFPTPIGEGNFSIIPQSPEYDPQEEPDDDATATSDTFVHADVRNRDNLWTAPKKGKGSSGGSSPKHPPKSTSGVDDLIDKMNRMAVSKQSKKQEKNALAKREGEKNHQPTPTVVSPNINATINAGPDSILKLNVNININQTSNNCNEAGRRTQPPPAVTTTTRIEKEQQQQRKGVTTNTASPRQRGVKSISSGSPPKTTSTKNVSGVATTSSRSGYSSGVSRKANSPDSSPNSSTGSRGSSRLSGGSVKESTKSLGGRIKTKLVNV